MMPDIESEADAFSKQDFNRVKTSYSNKYAPPGKGERLKLDIQLMDEDEVKLDFESVHDIPLWKKFLTKPAVETKEDYKLKHLVELNKNSETMKKDFQTQDFKTKQDDRSNQDFKQNPNKRRSQVVKLKLDGQLKNDNHPKNESEANHTTQPKEQKQSKQNLVLKPGIFPNENYKVELLRLLYQNVELEHNFETNKDASPGQNDKHKQDMISKSDFYIEIGIEMKQYIGSTLGNRFKEIRKPKVQQKQEDILKQELNIKPNYDVVQQDDIQQYIKTKQLSITWIVPQLYLKKKLKQNFKPVKDIDKNTNVPTKKNEDVKQKVHPTKANYKRKVFPVRERPVINQEIQPNLLSDTNEVVKLKQKFELQQGNHTENDVGKKENVVLKKDVKLKSDKMAKPGAEKDEGFLLNLGIESKPESQTKVKIEMEKDSPINQGIGLKLDNHNSISQAGFDVEGEYVVLENGVKSKPENKAKEHVGSKEDFLINPKVNSKPDITLGKDIEVEKDIQTKQDIELKPDSQRGQDAKKDEDNVPMHGAESKPEYYTEQDVPMEKGILLKQGSLNHKVELQLYSLTKEHVVSGDFSVELNIKSKFNYQIKENSRFNERFSGRTKYPDQIKENSRFNEGFSGRTKYPDQIKENSRFNEDFLVEPNIESKPANQSERDAELEKDIKIAQNIELKPYNHMRLDVEKEGDIHQKNGEELNLDILSKEHVGSEDILSKEHVGSEDILVKTKIESKSNNQTGQAVAREEKLYINHHNMTERVNDMVSGMLTQGFEFGTDNQKVKDATSRENIMLTQEVELKTNTQPNQDSKLKQDVVSKQNDQPNILKSDILSNVKLESMKDGESEQEFKLHLNTQLEENFERKQDILPKVPTLLKSVAYSKQTVLFRQGVQSIYDPPKPKVYSNVYHIAEGKQPKHDHRKPRVHSKGHGKNIHHLEQSAQYKYYDQEQRFQGKQSDNSFDQPVYRSKLEILSKRNISKRSVQSEQNPIGHKRKPKPFLGKCRLRFQHCKFNEDCCPRLNCYEDKSFSRKRFCDRKDFLS